jgi:hypothetical protein
MLYGKCTRFTYFRKKKLLFFCAANCINLQLLSIPAILFQLDTTVQVSMLQILTCRLSSLYSYVGLCDTTINTFKMNLDSWELNNRIFHSLHKYERGLEFFSWGNTVLTLNAWWYKDNKRFHFQQFSIRRKLRSFTYIVQAHFFLTINWFFF